MKKLDANRFGRFLSKFLRHTPEELGLTLESGGWVSISKLLQACRGRGMDVNQELLDDVVRTDSKTRFSFNEHKTKIRANQGHSASVELHFEKHVPPDILFHGTAAKFTSSLKNQGILKMSRHHVHLSSTQEVAQAVGKRHGFPLVISINAKQMHLDGINFFKSENGVWLVDYVHPKYFVEI